MKMKKIMLALLCLAMVVSAAGCGEKEEVAYDDNTFTYWCKMPSGIVSVYESLNDIPMYQKLEEITGVHIEFIHPPTGQEGEQFSLMLASKDYPDLIEGSWSSYPGGQEKAIKDNVIISLNDVIEEHAPDFYKLLKENEYYDKLCKTNNGDYYMFPYINGSKNRIFGGLMLRSDWLEELDLPVPETIEQWETTLRAFKEKKGAKAPFTCYFSVMGDSVLENAFNGAFDVGKRLYLDGDQIKFGPMEDEYKDWLSLMNKWYEEGLLDVDYGSNTVAAVTSKMSNGEAGATFGYIGGLMGPLLQMNEGKEFDLVAAPYVSGKDGVPHFAALEADIVDNGSLAITTACHNPEKAVEWANIFYTNEGMMLRTYGVEGISYNMIDGQPKFIDDILNNSEGISISEMLQRHSRVNQANPGYTTAEVSDNVLGLMYKFQQQKDAFGVWAQAVDTARPYLKPNTSIAMEDADELAALNGEISTYVDEMIFKFINGSEPMENFDKFRENLKNMNVDRYIEIHQNSYNVFLER